MKIAVVGAGVVGAGIAGLTAASRLHRHHEVTVFEANDWVGGHTNTSGSIAPTAPGTSTRGSSSSTTATTRTPARCSRAWRGGAEYAHGVQRVGGRRGLRVRRHARGLVFQPRNLARPAFTRTVADLLRFNREMRALLASGEDGPPLSEYLERGGYSRWFVERLIVPQASAGGRPILP